MASGVRLPVLDRQRVDRAAQRVAVRLRGDDVGRADGTCRMPPQWLVLGINNFCNLKCRMCDVGLGETGTMFWANLIGNDPRNMSLELLREIVDQARAFRPRPNIGLAFTEPLIHVGILDFCSTIVEAGFPCEITTNGTLLPRLADDLVRIGVDEIVVSVDGPAEVHDRVRGRPGTFAKLAEGVERLNAAKARLGRDRPQVRFSFTITDVNYEHVLEFVREVEPLSPAAIQISQLNFISDEMVAVHNAHYRDDLSVARSNLGEMDPAAFDVDAIWEELQRVRAYAESRGRGLPRLQITPDFRDRAAVARYYRDPLTFAGGRVCTDPWRFMMIKTDGTVIPAHGRCYDFPVGDVRERPLSEIWNGPRFREFRRTLTAAGGTLPACARCCGVIGKPPTA